MKQLENQLDRFLFSEQNKILSIKGQWGVGKTFFWNTFLNNKKESLNSNDRYRGYCYVSLFGLSSISEVRKQIVIQMELFSESLTKKSLNIISKWSKMFKDVNFNGVSTSFLDDKIENFMMRDLLICLDDLERKEDSISTSSVLGLMSELAEQKNCKIVLIYNDEDHALGEDRKKELAEYKEKVIDIEVLFNPSIDQNVKLIFTNTPTYNLVEVLTEFSCNNIRIIQRIKSAIDYFDPGIREKYSFLWERFVNSLIVLSISYFRYQHEYDVDNLNELIGRTNNKLLFDNSSISTTAIDLTEEHPELSRALYELGYHVNEFDFIITQYLKNGFVSVEEYKSILSDEDYYARKWQAKNRSSLLWDKHRSLSEYTQSQFIEDHTRLLADDGQYLEFHEVFHEASTLQRIQGELTENQCELIKNIFDSYLEKVDVNKFTIEYQGQDLTENVSDEIKSIWEDAFQRHYKEEDLSLDEVMKLICPGDSSYNPNHISLLNRFTREDYEKWILDESEAGYYLRQYYKGFVYVAQQENKEVELINSKIKEAVEVIKSRDYYNKIRFEHYLK